ncbi:hypothetical protein WH47_03377 [Habropoda laboriosa]|uniref:Uncharacterized protein n=1 Tax=Habropoda laboriosa TaxID=597456 RepID=A0A0L7RBH7_9HYME|nr:hypothetical protein WH47_08043 [Habropoda laboriosa]KOC68219.1 hypothetical protein WH47_03377 [Habropoda laboriosa]
MSRVPISSGTSLENQQSVQSRSSVQSCNEAGVFITLRRSFTAKVLFTDEVTFRRCGMINPHKGHV